MKRLTVVLAAMALALAVLAAVARPQARAQDAQPPAADAPAPGVPGADAPPGDAPPADAPPADAPAEPAPETQPESAASPDAKYQEPMLAERLYEMAQSRLREATVTEPMWRQAAALLQAATRLSPKDPRFHRLLVEARLKVADTDGAIAALTAYRKLDPADRVAQIQLIDLYVEQMQTADARLGYLRDLLARESIPPEVRSHVAAQCTVLLTERSHDEAVAMVEEALRLYPLSPVALRLKLDLLGPDAAPPARAEVLATMLRSNPAQPDVVNELAGLVASAGLGKESLEWYSVAMRLYPRSGLPFPQGFVADAGSQLLISGQGQSLEALLTAYLQVKPDDADAWFLKLTKEKAASQKVDRKSVDEAWNALGGNLAEVCKAIMEGDAGAAQPPAAAGQPGGGPSAAAAPPAGAAAPTTRPATARPAPATAADAMAAAKRVKAGEAQEWQPALVATLADLAWLEVYFGEDAAAANNWVAALREIVPADSLTLNRLDGWLDLVAGRTERARGRLTSIADRDGLSAMGLVRLAAKDAGGQAEADELATRLLSAYRTGLVGAMVWAELHDNNRKPADPPGAAEVKAALEQFPRDWLQILEKPDAYYDLTADVDKVAHRYHEPMFGRVTLHNRTDYDLTIGTDGVLRPDVWVDARISGLLSQNFPGVAYDRVARYLVLPARSNLTQVIRIDQGALGDTLDQNPSASAQVTANVLVNPAPTSGGVGPGPAGQRKTFSKNFVRSGFALSQPAARRKLTAQVQGGSPAERILGLDLMAGYVRLFARQKNLDQATRALGGEFVGTISTSRSDPSKPVSTWATYLTARLNPDERSNAMDALLADEAWPARLLAALASPELGPEQQSELVTRLAESDPEPTVKQFAAATADYLRSRPATQPATADADAKPADARETAPPPAQGPSTPTEGPALAPGSAR